MDPAALLDLFAAVTDRIAAEVHALDDLRARGERPGQYGLDLVADRVALGLLLGAGVGVVSEESGDHHLDRPVVVVIDPVDGSTNASRGLPWYATSLCALDAAGPAAAMVTNLATGQRFTAARGGGATVDGHRLHPSGTENLEQAIVAFNDLPPRLAWRQARMLGATALDLCSVAAGTVDGYVDLSGGGVAPWDYLGALLICTEVGVAVVDRDGHDLITVDHSARRHPVAGTPALVSRLCAELAP